MYQLLYKMQIINSVKYTTRTRGLRKMNNITLKSIKCESIKSIFSSIADAEKISRAEISAKTDLSLVTVGKVADALLDMNIVCQVKEVKPQAGRRAGLLGVNPDKFAVILDITSYDFRVSVLDLRLNRVEKYVFNNKQDASYEENLNAFFYDTAMYIGRKYNFDNCFGIGVSCPGPYNESLDSVKTTRTPELSLLRLKEILRRYFKDIPLLIDSHINAAARSNVLHVENYEEKNIVYWYIGTRNVCGAFMVKGEIILGKDHMACEFGKIVDRSGLTLEERIGLSHYPEDYASVLVQPMYTIIKVLNPHTFIIECDIPHTYDDILPILKSKLTREFNYSEREFPEFYKACCKFRNSHRGLTMGLRDMWIDKLVFGNNN